LGGPPRLGSIPSKSFAHSGLLQGNRIKGRLAMKVKKDSFILSIVEKTVKECEREGTNWAEVIDDRLEAKGIALHDDKPDGRDHNIIARLADGREVYCETDGSESLGITNKYWNYNYEIEGLDGSEDTVSARNLSEAIRIAKAWLSVKYLASLELTKPSSLWVSGPDGEHGESITIQSLLK